MVGVRGAAADSLYQQWPAYFWLYPAFGVRGATWFLGASEWTFGTLLFLGFWNKKLGILGALGSCATFIGTVTIIPFIPDGWDASAGGFSRHDRKCPVSDEGRRAPGSVGLSAEAGCRKGSAVDIGSGVLSSFSSTLLSQLVLEEAPFSTRRL